MSKNVHTSGGGDIVIDSLVLRLRYDFTRRPVNIRNIDITTNDGLLPYITCSEVDRNGRSNGKGSFHRSYNRSNNTVTFTALEKYGTYHFLYWTDRLGNIVSETPELTVTKQIDRFYKANYERRIPVLSVPDTVFVSPDGGEYTIYVQNIGLGDIDMDWYISDSLSNWVHLNDITHGINDGYFTFTCGSTNTCRLDSLEIFAPETEILSKMIYVVQSTNYFNNEEDESSIKIYPNPTNSCVYVECENMEFIQVYSSIGREVAVKRLFNENYAIIDMNALQNGFYYFRIKTSSGFVLRKIIKM